MTAPYTLDVDGYFCLASYPDTILLIPLLSFLLPCLLFRHYPTHFSQSIVLLASLPINFSLHMINLYIPSNYHIYLPLYPPDDNLVNTHGSN